MRWLRLRLLMSRGDGLDGFVMRIVLFVGGVRNGNI